MSDQKITMRLLKGHNGRITTLALSPDHKFLAGAGDKSDPRIHIWDPWSGNVINVIDSGHKDDVLSLNWSADGRRLYSVEVNGNIFCWGQPTENSVLSSFNRKAEKIHAFAQMRNGRIVYSTERYFCEIYEGKHEDLRSRVSENSGNPITYMAFNEDETRLAVGYASGEVVIVQVRSFAIDTPLLSPSTIQRKHNGAVSCLAWHNGALISGSVDGSIKDDHETKHCIYGAQIKKLTFADEGILLVSSVDASLHNNLSVVQFPEMRFLKNYSNFTSSVDAMCFLGAEKRFLITSSNMFLSPSSISGSKPAVLDFGAPNLGYDFVSRIFDPLPV